MIPPTKERIAEIRAITDGYPPNAVTAVRELLAALDASEAALAMEREAADGLVDVLTIHFGPDVYAAIDAARAAIDAARAKVQNPADVCAACATVPSPPERNPK